MIGAAAILVMAGAVLAYTGLCHIGLKAKYNHAVTSVSLMIIKEQMVLGMTHQTDEEAGKALKEINTVVTAYIQKTISGENDESNE